MQFGWQEFIALSIVAMAIAYLARQAWQLLKGKKSGGCGTCSSCDTTSANRNGEVISIESLVESGRE